jgi:hypothetical protein
MSPDSSFFVYFSPWKSVEGLVVDKKQVLQINARPGKKE